MDDTCKSSYLRDSATFEQPETFAIGGGLEAQLSWEIACRMVLERQMEQRGFPLHEMPLTQTQ